MTAAPRPASRQTIAAALAAAALLVCASPATAARDRLAGGDATVALSTALRQGLAGKGVRLRAIEPAKLGRGRLAFTVRGGELDPTTGRGTISLGLGGLQLRRGRKAAAVRSLTIDTRRGEVSANVAGRKLKLASLGGWSETREGFGVDLAIRRLRLSGPAAARLNRRLGFRALAGGQILGSALAETHPSAVSVLPGGGVSLTASEATLAKLTQVGVSVLPLAPTAKLDPLSPKPVFSSSISGGAIGPAANAGVLQTTGGILLVQELGSLVSRVWIEEIELDLGAGAVTAEVFGESNAETGPGQRPLDFGDMRRVSLATLAAAGAEVSTDPAARTVSVERAAATLQPVAAEILDDFVEAYERATKSGGKEKLSGGDPLGAVSFAVQTQ
ncbi:MAG TPA: hypothetical protein VK889_11015 [Solirubrobacterales bacterium]|nr:hypothetical protein [Solirubrobacterales bacterium]